MYRLRNSFVFLIVVLLTLVACQPEQVEVTRVVSETEQVEVTRVIVETRVVEGESVEVTRVVEVTVPAPTEEAATAKEEIVVADALPAVTLDPHKEGFSQADTEIILAIHDRLVGWEAGVEGSEVVGNLATDWNVSEDGLTWTFNLRDDVVWQDGYGQFTADDVVFSFERLMNPDISRSFGLVEGVIESVNAVDDYTVEFILAVPNADFVPAVLLQFRTGTIVSRAALADIGDDDYGRNPVGTGPYQLVERAVGDRTVIERNPDYWGEQPEVPRYIFVEIPEETVRADALEAGEIDIGSFRAPTTINRLSQNEVLSVEITYDRPAIWVIAISDKSIPDVRIRRAIAHAIDKHELAETVLQYRSNPDVVAYHGPGLAGFPDEQTEELYPYNPDRAQELLGEAGISAGELTLFYPTREDFLELSQAVSGYLEAIGINVELEVQEQALFRESITSQGEAYDLTNFFPSRATANEMLAYYGAPIGTNQFEDGPPESVLELYQQQSQELDPQRRAELIQEMLDIVHEEVPWVVIGYAASAATVHQPFIDGPFINYVSELNLPVEHITIDQDAYRAWLQDQ